MWKTVSFLAPPAAASANRRPRANLLVVLAVAMGGCAAAPPRWSMPRASVGDSPDSAPLTAGLWEQAEFTAPLTGPIVDGVSPPSETGPWTTRAKFAWDPGHLYMLVESVGPRPSSPFTRHDELLHQADAIELFLDVTGNRRRIVEVQVNPGNVTADYLHVWDRKPTYPAHRIDADFYRAHHRADLAWDVRGLRTRSVLAPAGDGLTRWTVLMAVPLSEILAADGLTTPLRPGQTLYVNVMRYAYTGEDNRRTLRHYNLVPVRQGCPHQSPMATMELTAVE